MPNGHASLWRLCFTAWWNSKSVMIKEQKVYLPLLQEIGINDIKLLSEMTNGLCFLFNQEERIKSYKGTLDPMFFGC